MEGVWAVGVVGLGLGAVLLARRRGWGSEDSASSDSSSDGWSFFGWSLGGSDGDRDDHAVAGDASDGDGDGGDGGGDGGDAGD